MKTAKFAVKGLVLAAIAMVALSTPASALCNNINDLNNSGKHYSSTRSNAFPVKCSVRIGGADFYATDQASCTKAVVEINNENGCSEGSDLEGKVRDLISRIMGVVGILAVIMIILGGINYVLSQGDSGKVKKAKDTIMYGIIGLVITLLAYAIVNFVLSILGS